MTQGKHFDKGKPMVECIPTDVLLDVGAVFTYADKKYGTARNWEQGIKWGKVFGSLLRHLFKFWMGEDYDKESGHHHLAHAICDAMFLLHYTKFKKQFDDRPSTKEKRNRCQRKTKDKKK